MIAFLHPWADVLPLMEEGVRVYGMLPQIYPYMLLLGAQMSSWNFWPLFNPTCSGRETRLRSYVRQTWKLSDTTVLQTPGLPFPTPPRPHRRFQGQERAEAEIGSLGSGAAVVHRRRSDRRAKM